MQEGLVEQVDSFLQIAGCEIHEHGYDTVFSSAGCADLIAAAGLPRHWLNIAGINTVVRP